MSDRIDVVERVRAFLEHPANTPPGVEGIVAEWVVREVTAACAERLTEVADVLSRKGRCKCDDFLCDACRRARGLREAAVLLTSLPACATIETRGGANANQSPNHKTAGRAGGATRRKVGGNATREALRPKSLADIRHERKSDGLRTDERRVCQADADLLAPAEGWTACWNNHAQIAFDADAGLCPLCEATALLEKR